MSLRNNLISVPILAANGYTTVFPPCDEGVKLYHLADVDILPQREPFIRVLRDKSGLWGIPLVDNVTEEQHINHIEEIQLPEAQIHHLYHLPSVEARVAYIHACLGFPTKTALLNAASAGRLVGIPFATVSNINWSYPETIKTPKGHMSQQRQGV